MELLNLHARIGGINVNQTNLVGFFSRIKFCKKVLKHIVVVNYWRMIKS